MKVCVLGLWHLGAVTAACLAAAGHDVIGLDVDDGVVRGLSAGTAPVVEPGLDDLVKGGLDARRLRFTSDLAAAAGEADVLWIAFDTPVDEDDRADVEFVVERATRTFPHLRDGALVLVSSQVPVGTTAALERAFVAHAAGRGVAFAYSPENLRLGNALAAFTRPDRIVVGVRTPEARAQVEALLSPLAARIEWMSVESAEMTKHAINGFLATSVAFINEVAAICERVGADASEVERGLKTESRIGPRAYLSPGGAFAGGTLARDIVFLSRLGGELGVPTHLLSSVKASNDAHRRWAARRLERQLGGLSGKRVAIWGLTYKPGTSTLRRSSAIELCQWLAGQGASVRAHDPAVRRLPEDLDPAIELAAGALDAVTGASALVIATPWPAYRDVDPAAVAARLHRRLVLDAGRFTAATLGARDDIEYVSVGTPR